MRSKAKARYDREVAEAKRRYEETLAALEVVEREFGSPDESQGTRGRRGALADAVREIVEGISSPFTVNDVKYAMQSRFPDVKVNPASLASALIRIVETLPNIETEKFGGRRPSVFWKQTPGTTRPERNPPTSHVGPDNVQAAISEQSR